MNSKLRKKAEEILKNRDIENRALYTKTLEELIEELKIHQIELEHQNDELTSTQKELERSEKRYRELFNNSPVGYLIIDLDYKILTVNKTICSLMNLYYHELMEQRFSKFIHPEFQDKFYFYIKNIDKIESNNVVDLKIKRSKEDYFYARLTSKVEGDGSDQVLIKISVTDITEQKKAEEELVKLEKLRSIGRLAGGIAHDFNNILTVIYGNLSLLKMDISQHHPSYNLLNETEMSISRATKLSNQLLTFSKGGDPQKSEVNLTKILTDIINFDLSGSDLKPVFDFEDNIYKTNVDIGQIQQVFSNLIINAVQASPKGSELYISVENFYINESDSSNLQSGQYLKVKIKDKGVGIPSSDLDKIFDPYFTSKDTGHGLGLSTTYSIVKKHEGDIVVESTVGVGTTFTILLPATQNIEDTDPNTNVNHNKIINSVKKYKILIMDDDSSILRLLSRMLKRLDYDVEQSYEGSEAIEKYKESFNQGRGFDLTILDLTIPGGMGGKETVKEILKIDKSAKVVVSSGYTNEALISEYKSHGFIDVIGKPYTSIELEKILERVLKLK